MARVLLAGGFASAHALAPLRLVLDPTVNPRHYGQLVQFGKIVPWR